MSYSVVFFLLDILKNMSLKIHLLHKSQFFWCWNLICLVEIRDTMDWWEVASISWCSSDHLNKAMNITQNNQHCVQITNSHVHMSRLWILITITNRLRIPMTTTNKLRIAKTTTTMFHNTHALPPRSWLHHNPTNACEEVIMASLVTTSAHPQASNQSSSTILSCRNTH